jgi:hypothetical protein
VSIFVLLGTIISDNHCRVSPVGGKMNCGVLKIDVHEYPY